MTWGVLMAAVSAAASCGGDVARRGGQGDLRPQIEKGALVHEADVQGHVGVFLVGGRDSECGGTFVSRTVILTAAHCIATRSASAWEVRWGGTMSSALPHRAVGTRRAIPAAYLERQDRDADVALLALDKSAAGDAQMIGTAAPAATLIVHGWGWVDGSGTRVDALQEARLRHSGALTASVRLMTSITGKPCRHDSGGGVRQVRRGASVLVGVLIQADSCGSGGTGAGYVPSEAWSGWVAACLGTAPRNCTWTP